ncbi:MAG: hypothetical protein QXT13_10170 [Pyrobaculum sp.]
MLRRRSTPQQTPPSQPQQPQTRQQQQQGQQFTTRVLQLPLRELTGWGEEIDVLTAIPQLTPKTQEELKRFYREDAVDRYLAVSGARLFEKSIAAAAACIEGECHAVAATSLFLYSAAHNAITVLSRSLEEFDKTQNPYELLLGLEALQTLSLHHATILQQVAQAYSDLRTAAAPNLPLSIDVVLRLRREKTRQRRREEDDTQEGAWY